MFHIEVRQFGLRIPAAKGASVIDCLRKAGLEIVSPCGGKGLCKQCTVHVSGNQDSIKESVLACTTIVDHNMAVTIPERTLFVPQQVLLASKLEEPAAVKGDRARPVDKDAPLLGLAVDIGTTTIAGYLVDLHTGVTLGAEGLMNPQIAFGTEIIARLEQALNSPAKARLLQERITGALEELIVLLCTASGGYAPQQIKEIVAVGNTAMHHMLMNADISRLARAPFSPSVHEDTKHKASELGLSLCADALVYMPAPVAGFVGSDHVAVLNAIGTRTMKEPVLVLDIGTNTEISMVTSEGISCVSCASGGAFEGRNISSGMTASEGAIDHVVLDGNEIRYHTIGDAAPIGICGSGIFDALAQMVVGKVIDSSGRIRESHPRVNTGNNGREFVIAIDEGNGAMISVTQGDVRALQLAKAAIGTGIRILLQEGGLLGEDVTEIVIAGGFGSYLDIRSAIAIGMLPDLPIDKFRQVGNAAGVGARNYLLSHDARKNWHRMKDSIHYLELVKIPGFQTSFLSELALRPWE